MDRDLDILILLPGIPLRYHGGYSNLFYDIARRLSNDGHKVGILFLRDVYKSIYQVTHKPEVLSYLKKKGAVERLYQIVVNSKIGLYVILPLLKLILRIHEIPPPDNVKIFFSRYVPHNVDFATAISSCWETSLVLNSYTKAVKRFNFVLHEEDDLSFSGELSGLARLSYLSNGTKIVINKRVYERFIDESPILIQDGIDINRFPLLHPIIGRELHTIAIPLRQGKSKGLEMGLSVIKKLNQEMGTNIRIIAFGDAKKDELPEYIDFFGIVNHTELVDIYNSASIFLLPSTVEGIALTGLEAMVSGCVLVSTDNGGVREYLKDGDTGFIVPVNDVEAMYQTVVKLMNQPGLLNAVAEKGRKVALGFNHEKRYSDLLDALNSN